MIVSTHLCLNESVDCKNKLPKDGNDHFLNVQSVVSSVQYQQFVSRVNRHGNKLKLLMMF